jgi:hypothetical protein
MTDDQPTTTREAILQELLAAIKANIPVARGFGPCSAEPSFDGDWEVADRDCAERVKKAAAALEQSMGCSSSAAALTGQNHCSAKEALVQELLAAIETNKPFATGTGRCPAVPCFDRHDREAERNRPGWEVVERDCAERVRKAAAALFT